MQVANSLTHFTTLHKRRQVFNVDEKSHAGHMKAVNAAVLDGTSKWSAKIGAYTCNYLVGFSGWICWLDLLTGFGDWISPLDLFAEFPSGNFPIRKNS